MFRLTYKVFLSTQLLILTDTNFVYSVLPTNWDFSRQEVALMHSVIPQVVPQAALWQILLPFFPLPMLSASESISDPKFSRQAFLSLMYKYLSLLFPPPFLSSSHYFWASCMAVKGMPKLCMHKTTWCPVVLQLSSCSLSLWGVFHSQAGKSSTWMCCSRAQHTAQHRAEPFHCSSGCKVTKAASFQQDLFEFKLVEAWGFWGLDLGKDFKYVFYTN